MKRASEKRPTANKWSVKVVSDWDPAYNAWRETAEIGRSGHAAHLVKISAGSSKGGTGVAHISLEDARELRRALNRAIREIEKPLEAKRAAAERDEAQAQLAAVLDMVTQAGGTVRPAVPGFDNMAAVVEAYERRVQGEALHAMAEEIEASFTGALEVTERIRAEVRELERPRPPAVAKTVAKTGDRFVGVKA